MTTVREALFDLMRRLDMTKIFGNVGSTEEPMLQDFPEDFDYILALQEATAVAMADGYAQATGKVVHVNLHTAAGSGNAMGNIQTAFYNRTPMIITAGQQARPMLVYEPYLTNKSPIEQAKPWVKWSYEPARAEDVPAAFLRAYLMAVQAPPGPVYLSLPMDDMGKECPGLPPIRRVETRLSAGEDVLASVAEALAAARQPALVFGGAVDQGGGWEDGIRLAEKSRAAVWAAPLEGQPGFPETHPQFQGVLAPGQSSIAKQLESFDLIVVIGAPVFRYYPYAPSEPIPEKARLILISDNPEEIARAVVGDAVLCDAARACVTLTRLLPESDRPLPPPIQQEPAPEATEPLSAEFVYATIEKMRPSDSIIVQESLSTLTQLHKLIPTSNARSFYSFSSGVLGYGLAAAPGVSLAERDKQSGRKVICIMGDGATQYVVQAFWTTAKQNLPVFFVIMRNHRYDILHEFENYLGERGVPGFDISGIDTVKLAEGYGCTGVTVTTASELEAAIRQGLSATTPFVMQVDVKASTPPLLGQVGPKEHAV